MAKNQNVTTEIRRIQRRDRQLWLIAVLVILALTVTIIGIQAPELLGAPKQASVQLKIYLVGLSFLIFLFCAYVLQTGFNLLKEMNRRSEELIQIKQELEKEVSERKRAEEKIKSLAYYDTLTSLPSRTLLKDRLQQAILAGQRDGKQGALLMMDLERFKEVNDTLGHHRGDLLLQQVGSRLRGVLFEPDTVSRLGGDEFAVLLPKLAATEHIQAVIQKIQEALKAPFVIEDLPIAVEASIGIALFPIHGTNADTLLQLADVAMYVAKRTGSGYAIYAPELDVHSPRRLALMGGLRQAIDRDQLLLHYQPKLDLKTSRVTGVEALVRWQHPEYGFLGPDQFIAQVERTELIKPLTEWVLSTALRQCQAWHQMGLEVSMAVNLSVRNFQDPQLPNQVTELLSNSGVAPRFLGLEITEGILMADPPRAREVLTSLNQMEIRLSIDDFGTGYSSLAYLKKLPVDEIKIDRSFVKDMVTNQDDAMIVRSTIDLAHNLGLKVVAEGVEDRETRDWLVAFGCDAAQGYYMSRPIPADDLTRWFGESSYGLKRA